MNLPKPIRAPKPKRPIQRKARVKKRAARKTLVRQCDKLWSDLVRGKGYCVLGIESPAHVCKGAIQAMHGLSRRYQGTRWELVNGFPGCQAAHFYWTKEPMAWTRWLIERWGLSFYDQMWRQAQAGKPKDMNAVKTALETHLALKEQR